MDILTKQRQGLRMRRTKGNEKRLTIIQAAVEVISTEGVHGVTTRKIASCAGVHLATLHYHFDNKEALLLAILEHLATTSRARLSAMLTVEETLHDRIASLLRAIWDDVLAHPAEQITLYNLTLYALSKQGAEWMAGRKYEDYLDIYRETLGAALDVTDRTQPVDVERLSYLISASIIGIILQWLPARDNTLAVQKIDDLILSARDFVQHARLAPSI